MYFSDQAFFKLKKNIVVPKNEMLNQTHFSSSYHLYRQLMFGANEILKMQLVPLHKTEEIFLFSNGHIVVCLRFFVPFENF